MKFQRTLAIFLIIIFSFASLAVVYASPDIDGDVEDRVRTHMKKDNKQDPLTTKQLELKAKALEAKLKGKGVGNIVEVAKGKFVELERDNEGAIWTVLGEFADYTHNSIPKPDRTVDNSTIWVLDFSRDYYMDILFNDADGANSMRNYYIEQSSGRFAVYGDVTDWITVAGNHEKYDDNPDSNVWLFLEESVNGWYESQLNANKSPEEINEYLRQFDVWDRYDYDGDGVFNEPDGYIDTFQSVHAGEGEEAGGGELGDEAIWSHSWYANFSLIGTAGPEFNLMGGIQVGQSDFWIGKYTIQPENGGVGVFAHEFGHDMGLPDLYDYYGENSTGFWTLMSSGSWLSDGTEDIGSKPCHLNAWEKFQLGWLNYEMANTEVESVHSLGPVEFNSTEAQGVIVDLPQKEVTTEIGDPFAGSFFYYSGMGIELDNYMYKSFELNENPILNAKINYEIELDWDYGYVVVSTDDGDTWTSIETNLSTQDDPNGQNFGYGITGASDGWIDLSAELGAYANQTVLVGFRYWTDGAVNELGMMIDDIIIADYPIDGAEDESEWTFDGFRTSSGTEYNIYSSYYVCEFRTYYGYDNTLQVGPYNFGYKKTPNLVDHFAYQHGLLIHYWDTSQADNDTELHPGHGLLLPIDAHFDPLFRNGKNMWRNRIQTYDSTFSKEPTDGIPNIHYNGKLYPIPSLPGVSAFDDRILHYDYDNPLGSVIHPNTGTIITILNEPSLNISGKRIPIMTIQVSTAN